MARILRKATSRGRVIIALMAFSGLTPESLGNYEGTDGLRLEDIKELKLSDEIEFDKIPVTIMVRNRLSKAWPEMLIETDITYIPTNNGMTYLMCIKDVFSKEWYGYNYNTSKVKHGSKRKGLE